MRCPVEISEILLGLLERGLLRVRSLAWSGRADLCAVEADHLHNIPSLLSDYSEEKLRYYWEVERPCFIEQMPPDQLVAWEALWEPLRPHAEAHSGSTASP
jgi:hypothetical protein